MDVLQIFSVCNTLSELGRNFDYGCWNSKNVGGWNMTKVTWCPLSLEIIFKEHTVAHDYIAVVQKMFIFLVMDITFLSIV